jgi:hypothetical protein
LTCLAKLPLEQDNLVQYTHDYTNAKITVSYRDGHLASYDFSPPSGRLARVFAALSFG